jgi:HAD superfamily hydrolase (TIGR01509 family)
MLHAVIFDVDGTLVDSNDLHARAWQEAFTHFGVNLPFEQVRSQIGKGGDQLLPSLLTPEQVADFGKELEQYRSQLFKEKYLHQVRGFPCVRELFQRILADRHKIALASSAKKDELDVLKQIAHIEDLIDEETSSDDAEKSKPHPDIFAAALERLNVKADEAVAVGDSPYDAKAATQLHLRTIGLLCGGFPETELRTAGAVEIFQSPADLLKRYGKSILAELPVAA